MLTTEKTFEILPYVSDIYEKIDINDFITKYKKKSKNKKKSDENQIIAGLDLFSYLFKRSPEIKEEIFNIIAILKDKEIEEVRSQHIAKTMKELKEMFSDKELVDFFKGAMQ